MYCIIMYLFLEMIIVARASNQQDTDGNFSMVLEWLVERNDPKIICHSAVVLFADLLWTRMAQHLRTDLPPKKNMWKSLKQKTRKTILWYSRRMRVNWPHSSHSKSIDAKSIIHCVVLWCGGSVVMSICPRYDFLLGRCYFMFCLCALRLNIQICRTTSF